MFSRVLGRAVPYSGTLRPRVVSLDPGRAVVEMNDRRGLRNHLGSVHAIALANLGELASGLAMTASLAPEVRSIVTHLEIDYLKKARGPLTAVGQASPPSSVSDSVDTIATADITDSGGDVVARVRATWQLRPPRTTRET